MRFSFSLNISHTDDLHISPVSYGFYIYRVSSFHVSYVLDRWRARQNFLQKKTNTFDEMGQLKIFQGF